MRIDDQIYFAPGIRFQDLNWDNPLALVDAFKKRVCGLYLIPAQDFITIARNDPDVNRLPGLAFGCGVLCSTAIDFLAGFEFFPSKNVSVRYEKWLLRRIGMLAQANPGNPKKTLAVRFYEDFRNGLVHEGRIKNASQFSLDQGLFQENPLYTIIQGTMIVNPAELLECIRSGLNTYLDETQFDENSIEKLKNTLNSFFSADIELINKNG